MLFSSPIFMFGFLPVVLFLYYISPRFLKNITLLIASLFFYAWGEVFYLGVMFVSIVVNYCVGILLNSSRDCSSNLQSKIYICIGVVANIVLLTSFKYVNFIADNINQIFSLSGGALLNIEPVHLPLGISFFTFQAISYIVDVYRKKVDAQSNFFNLALYISLFPQLIAGPIVRYQYISSQIESRTHSLEMFSSGVKQFICGLAKKMLIANPLGEVADTVFVLSGGDLTMPIAWIGILAYTLQIYFDFSGYSDMAIGLGKMFGFKFLENFNYPYISTSLREFWRRWHISLSFWFKDYVYIPLGGGRVSVVRVYLNLFLVFSLTGIWHGASWNFLIWGLFHGIFLAIEHAGFTSTLKKIWRPLQHIYLLLIIIIGWVFFRSNTLSEAINYLTAMFDMSNIETSPLQLAQILSHESVIVFCIGVILATPVYPTICLVLDKIHNRIDAKKFVAIDMLQVALFAMLLFLSLLKLSSYTYNPFIYFRF